MTTYKVYSKSGEYFGQWSGQTKADALASMHNDAGYSVSAHNGEIIFPDSETKSICGDVDNWDISSAANARGA